MICQTFFCHFHIYSFCIHFLNLYYDDGKYFLFDYEVFDTLQIVFRDIHEPKQRFDLLESNNTTVRTVEQFRKLDLHDLMTPRGSITAIVASQELSCKDFIFQSQALEQE